MRTVGDRFPSFRCPAVIGRDPASAFQELSDASAKGRWKVFFFWPKDFTFVCPTEIAGFAALEGEFAARGAVLYGGSTDSEYVHRAWLEASPMLANVRFPLIADVKRELSMALGILHPLEGVCLRATFIVDPDGVIRYAAAHDLSTGRSPEEVLRTLDALQTGELCPAGWQRGAPTLEAR